jgi:hypothetical protein
MLVCHEEPESGVQLSVRPGLGPLIVHVQRPADGPQPRATAAQLNPPRFRWRGRTSEVRASAHHRDVDVERIADPIGPRLSHRCHSPNEPLPQGNRLIPRLRRSGRRDSHERRNVGRVKA